MKRIIAFVLSVVMLISVIPAQQLFAAGTAEEHYFELDTDGIDAGADYLIVSAKIDGTAYALQNGNISGKKVTISNQKIDKFDGDDSCIWTFEGAENSTVANGSDYLHIQNEVSFDSNISILSFANFTAGTYGIYLEDSTNQSLHYLRYDAQEWKTEVNLFTKSLLLLTTSSVKWKRS